MQNVVSTISLAWMLKRTHCTFPQQSFCGYAKGRHEQWSLQETLHFKAEALHFKFWKSLHFGIVRACAWQYVSASVRPYVRTSVSPYVRISVLQYVRAAIDYIV